MTDVVVHVLPVLVGEVDLVFDPSDDLLELLDGEFGIGDLVLLLGDVLVELLETLGTLGLDPPGEEERRSRGRKSQSTTGTEEIQTRRQAHFSTALFADSSEWMDSM